MTHKAAAGGLPTLADKGCIGAGIGIRVPVRRPKGRSEQALHADTRTANSLIRDIRALGQRAGLSGGSGIENQAASGDRAP